MKKQATQHVTARRPGRRKASDFSQNENVPKGRKAKFYDDVLNQRIRELMDERGVRTEDFANAVGISSSAVRMWHTGYARPDIEKIPAICSFFDISADYLLGLSSIPAVDIEIRDICEKTGLNHNALLNLLKIVNSVPEGSTSFSPATAKEMLWLVNNLLEDTAILMKLADVANNYVQIRNEADEPYGEVAVDNTVVKLMEMGLKKFGPTFNFTVGRETAENLLFLCQRYFTELLENVDMPAYLIGMGYGHDEHDGQDE